MSNVIQMPERRPVNQRVGLNVSLIMRMRGKTQAQLAGVLGITQASASRRISGMSPWTPDELEATAAFLNVAIGRLFEELPGLDSNQEPAG
ncbi:helix-turn-helix domain-containing protein [Microbacterium soli]|uniref:helix-turn-helix domain-containing protein n=1 Tax=Microbacterium soli TaxID=446075 RepID=UPI003CD0A5A3